MKRALLLCLLAAPALAAADQYDQWYLTPEVGGISPDYKRALQDQDWLFGLSAGRELNQFLNLELNFNGTRLEDRDAPGHLYNYATSLDLLGVLNRDGVVSPFLSVGAGVRWRSRAIPMESAPRDTTSRCRSGARAPFASI